MWVFVFCHNAHENEAQRCLLFRSIAYAKEWENKSPGCLAKVPSMSFYSPLPPWANSSDDKMRLFLLIVPRKKKYCHFMQNVEKFSSKEDSLQQMAKLIFCKKGKKSKQHCHLLNILPSMLSFKETVYSYSRQLRNCSQVWF